MLEPYLSDPDVTLYCGDALDVLRELPDESADCCVTSPPYLDARPEYPSPSLAHFEDIFRELGRVVAGSMLLNVGRLWREHCERLWWTALLERAAWVGWLLRDTLVWVKPNANPIHGEVLANSHEYIFLFGDGFNVDAVRTPHAASTIARNERHWTNHRGVKKPRDSRARKTRVAPNPLGALPRSYVAIPVGTEKGKEHPAPMADALAEHLVKLGCPESGSVLDPFAGGGTTLYIARKLGRRAIGIELNADYCQLAADRLAQQSLFAQGTA
jgi:DNA modification methylase